MKADLPRLCFHFILPPSSFILLFHCPLNKTAGWKRMAAPLQPILAEGLDDP
jgi:hypothetical protein